MDKILKLEAEVFANKSIKAEEKVLTVYQPLHWHDFYELEYIIDGDGEYVINGSLQKIRPGMLFFSTPADIHEITFTAETRILNISFTAHYLNEKLISPTTTAYVADDKNEYYYIMLKNILEAVDGKLSNRTLYLQSMISAVLVMLSNKGTAVSIDRSTVTTHKNLRDLVFYVNSHFEESLDLQTLSQITNLTPKYLSKRFIELLGMSLSQYILEVRLDHAKKLVENSEISIKEICSKSGFNSLPHFSRSFKKKYGLSPSQARERRRNLLCLQESGTTDLKTIG